jgi:DNA-binding LacI/PurR family transcriptional regulator
MAPGGVVEKAELRALESLGCPCAMLQPNEHVRRGTGVCAVSPDYRAIGRVQVEALAAHGHARIAYVREEPWSRAGELHLEGLREGADKAGLPPSGIVVLSERTGVWGDAGKAAYARTRQLMTRTARPTALVFDTLAGAHAGQRALGELGFRVPAEVSILVSAPDHPFAHYDCPRIGGVWTPSGTLVERAVEAILASTPEPRIWVEPVVDLRESVASVLSAPM